MATIKVRAAHVSSGGAYQQVRDRYGAEELDDAVAVTIASWWQSPGSIGRHLAALASGVEVDFQALIDDISATRREHGYGTGYVHGAVRGYMADDDRKALDMLRRWAIRQVTD